MNPYVESIEELHALPENAVLALPNGLLAQRIPSGAMSPESDWSKDTYFIVAGIGEIVTAAELFSGVEEQWEGGGRIVQLGNFNITPEGE